MNEGSPATANQAPSPQRGVPAWLVLPGMLALVLLGLVAGRLVRPSTEVRGGEGPTPSAAWQPTPRPTGEIISLTINFGNGAGRSFAALPWRKGMTVLEALQAAAEFRPGIDFTYTGRGESAFLTSIDGLSNAGASGGNWIYEVNGQKPRQSMSLQTLDAGDALLWRYTGPP